MNAYLALLQVVEWEGEEKTDRTNTGTVSVFAPPDFKHYLQQGFPLLTTKRMFINIVIHELIWMLSGGTNTRYLRENGVTIWDEWADQDGNLGPIYGKQWRDFNNQGIDQIANLVKLIKSDPQGRRHMVTAWNPAQLSQMKLPACHYMFQCYVRKERFLDLKVNMRSTDIFLGLPYNIAFYGLLTHVLANVLDYHPGRLTISFGDLHRYSNHFQQVHTQLTRIPYKLPRLVVKRKLAMPWDLQKEDVELTDYNYHPHIPAPVAV